MSTGDLPLPACLAAGKGRRALVFLHGIGGCKEGFGREIQHFAHQNFRAVAWDAPGYGTSAPLAELNWESLSGALARLLDHLEIERAIPVGHSMGGMLAQEFAARFPDRLSALVLAGTSPAFGKADGDWQKKFVAARLAPLEAGRSMADLAPELVAGMIGEAPEPAGMEAAIASMSRVKPETYRAYIHLLTTFDRREALSRIPVPTLVLAGEKDRTAPPEVMERMAAKIPSARYRCLPKAGHLANLERPAEFAAALDEFLASLEETR